MPKRKKKRKKKNETEKSCEFKWKSFRRDVWLILLGKLVENFNRRKGKSEILESRRGKNNQKDEEKRKKGIQAFSGNWERIFQD